MAKRSYFSEIKEIESTWDSTGSSPPVITQHINLSWITGNAYCVGSGGSLALAKMWQLIHESNGFGLARTITPYEYFFSKSKPDIVIIFSASGKNHDILNVFKNAINQGCKILIFTTSPKSALVRLSKEHPTQSVTIYPSKNTPRDGFLTVNSVIAISCLMIQLEKIFMGNDFHVESPVAQAIDHHANNKLNLNGDISNTTFQIISSEWGAPAGLDIESRLAESGISPCFLTDPRNFGHGRFLWLEIKKTSTNIIIFHSPASRSFINRFERTIQPSTVPCYIVNSPYNNSLAAVYCLIRSILLFGELSRKIKIDPGKPEVPEWGRKLHRLQLRQTKSGDFLNPKPKFNKSSFPALSMSFSGVVLDMDGTLVNTKDRFNPIKEEIIEEIERLLHDGIILGIATGRGFSSVKILKNQISDRFHDKIIMGLYNGTLLTRLSEESKNFLCHWPLQSIITPFVKKIISDKVKMSARPTQISLRNISKSEKEKVLEEISTNLGQHLPFIKIKGSGHSIDILPFWATKITVVQAVFEIIKSNILCVGDQGQIGGNDEELLGWTPSICVGKSRPVSNQCLWLGKHKQFQESSGTLFVLQNIIKEKKMFRIAHIQYK